MFEWNLNASHMFNNANRFIEAYHKVLQPLCKETGLPPMAIDIMMFFANNPEKPTAKDVCFCRGWKPGIVSVHVERLVSEGLLERNEMEGDRRKTCLTCTKKARPIIEKGRECQKGFAEKLLLGLSKEDIAAFRSVLAVVDRNISDIRENGIERESTATKDL